jgi:hypothetical protein
MLGRLLALAFLVSVPALARDNGFENTPPVIRQWFQSLMQPDAPMV